MEKQDQEDSDNISS